jgi:hypothetical protein
MVLRVKRRHHWRCLCCDHHWTTVSYTESQNFDLD